MYQRNIDIDPSPADGHEANSAGNKRPSSSSARKGDAAQRAKRVRVSRACDQCRAGREKCDGGQPHCQTCESQGRNCSYHEQPKKRGIQPNYIRTLELTLAWLLDEFPESETRLSRLLPRRDESAHQLIAWKDPTSSENLHTAWRNGVICKQIDQLLSGAEIDVPKTPSPPRDEDGARTFRAETSVSGERLQPVASSTATALAQLNQGIQTNVPYQSPPLSAPSDLGPLQQEIHESMTGEPDFPPRNPRVLDNDDDSLRLPDNSWTLLEHYFAFTQTWLPIIERHDVLKQMYNYPSTGLARRDAIGSSGHAELWSIMALASLQINASSSHRDYEYCRDVAKSLIPVEQGFQLGHIKALLILGLSELMRKSWIAAWLVIGSAVRLLTHFHLGRGTNTTLFEGRTKHTILAAFVLENTVASRTSALCHIRPEDIRVVGLLIEDGLEEWSPWQDPTVGPSSAATKSPARSISTFNSLIRIAMRRQSNMQMASPLSQDQSSEIDAVFALLHNACSKTTRQHPSSVLSNTKIEHSPHDGTGRSSQFDLANAFMDQQYGYMSIPNEGTESLVGSTPANQIPAEATPVMWNSENPIGFQDSTQNPGSVSDAVPGGDIFEELAMLDRSDSTQNPKFMQNLGFGPDLDLAEFFGPDYQFTDPSAFSDISQGFDGTGREPG